MAKAEISKAVGYAVLSVPAGAVMSKTVAYAVLSTEVNVAISKAVAYAVLAPPEAVGGGSRPFINFFY